MQFHDVTFRLFGLIGKQEMGKEAISLLSCLNSYPPTSLHLSHSGIFLDETPPESLKRLKLGKRKTEKDVA